jgi:hypothetical protein
MEKYCDGDKIYLEILIIYGLSAPPEYEKMVSRMLSDCMYLRVSR